jgi:hypothetical protein
MATSAIAGDYGFVRQITCILYEGNITVSTAYDYTGASTGTIGLSAGLAQGDWVSLSTDTGNTYTATGGLPVVCRQADTVDLTIGRIIDQPRWYKLPTASITSDWAATLSGKYYRVATIELAIPMCIFKATLICQNVTAITPGTTGNLDIDASETLAAHSLCVKDVGSSGATTMIPLTYAPAASSTSVSLLVGTTGFITVVA